MVQPTPNQETPLPNPEVKAGQPQAKPPDLVKMNRLKGDFDTAQSILNKDRALLKTAQAMNAGAAIIDSPEYQLISRRQQAGEPLDDIISKTAANTRSSSETTLDKELPYREAEASLLKSEVGSPATDRDIVRIVNSLEQNQTIGVDDPALAEVNRRKQAGETLMEIKTEAQETLDLHNRQTETLRMAELMRSSTARPLGTDIEVAIKNRVQRGESLDDIIAKTRANVLHYDVIDKKKGQLAETLKRIEAIKSEKQAIAKTRQGEQELVAQRKLQTARQKLEGMEETKHEDLESFLMGEFGIGETQITLLPEFNTVPKDEATDAKQLRIAQNLMELLKRKGALASPQENRDFYENSFELTGYSPPDEYLKYPAGATFLDSKSGNIKVYFNPGLQLFKADYQLLGILEESIHWSQLKQSGRNRVTWKDEAEAKERLLGLAESVGFDENRIQYLQKVRTYALSQSQNAQPQTPIE